MDYEVEVEFGNFVGGLVVVLVEAVAGDGLGDDAAFCEGVVVGALEEVLGGVGVCGDGCAVLGECGAEVGAFVAGEPEGARGEGGIGASHHFEFEVGDDFVEGKGCVVEEVLVAEAAELFRAEEDKEDGAFGARAVGERTGQL